MSLDSQQRTSLKGYFDLKNTLAKAEVYPDLELPTLDELDKVGYKFIRYATANGRVYPDPDFYYVYSWVIGSEVFRSAILKFFDEEANIQPTFDLTDSTGAKMLLERKSGPEVYKYTAENTAAKEILNKQDDLSGVTYADLQVSSYLIKDYMSLATSRLVTEQVIGDLGLNITHEDLVKLIYIVNPDETRVLNIRVEYKDPVTAKNIADAVRETTTDLITTISKNILVNQMKESVISERPSTPNVKRNTVLGGAIGIIISAFIIILRYLSNDTIKSPEEIEKYLDIRCLVTIPISYNIPASPKHRFFRLCKRIASFKKKVS
jgi:capsular polysaccharide biosynthesis protein